MVRLLLGPIYQTLGDGFMESSDDRGQGWRGKLVEAIRKLRDRPDSQRVIEEIRKLDDLKPNE